MPIYEFDCKECGASREGIVKVGVSTKECPSCGGVMTKREVSGSQSFYLKGVGVYSEKSMAPVVKSTK